MNKLSYFQSLVYCGSVDCFCVTETWLSANILDGEILPNQYVIYRQDRASKGGGVMIAVRNEICSRQVHTDCNLELVVVELEVKPKIIICCVYVPPTSTEGSFNALQNFILSLPDGIDLFLLGDFNSPDINWNTMSASNYQSSSLCDTIVAKNLIQMVTKQTHKQGNILDLILTNSPDKISNISLDPSMISDHYKISFDVEVTKHLNKGTGENNLEIDCYSRADLVGLEEYLLDRDFSHVEEANNADDSWTFLKGEIKHSSSLFVPKIRIPSSHSPKWFTAEIRHNVKKASTARRQVRKNPTTETRSY